MHKVVEIGCVEIDRCRDRSMQRSIDVNIDRSRDRSLHHSVDLDIDLSHSSINVEIDRCEIDI